MVRGRSGAAWLVVALHGLAIGLGGCLQPASSSCDNGGVCPRGLKCTNMPGAPICVPASCGNGAIDVGESCDDGNNLAGDGCPADCGPSPCGDGKLDPGETCDDRNLAAGDGCSPSCQLEVCGNGVVDPDEACDDHNQHSHDGCSARCTAERAEWSALGEAPDPRSGFALAYDAARGTVVLFGGRGSAGVLRDTWVWDGEVWRRRDPALAPTARAGHAMAYDAARRRLVVFGGERDDATTWEWDGAGWREHRPATSPPAQLAGAAMTYVAALREVVLFGGRIGDVDQDGTWAWNGETWRELATAATPPARSGHAMAYDSARGAVVMFGGLAGGQRLGDTWELDGTAWTRRAVAAAPEPRGGAAMTFDAPAGRIVMFGGDGDAGSLGDTWAWDGAGWTALAAGASPRARSGAAMAYDIVRRQVVLFGGQRPVDGAVTTAGLLDDTWIWDRGAWTSRTALRTTRPSPRSAYGLVRDAAQDVAVLFGGHTDNERVAGLTSDTWVWDGATWRALDAAPPLPPRIGFALGHDGRHVVMFGGARESGDLVEAADATWALIDARWVLQPTDTAPPARAGAAMAYDAARGKLVLFGGDDGLGVGLFDTWEWDGTRWAEVAAFGPPPRTDHVMVYDAARARVVLFGGLGPVALGDTWEWDGARWTERASADPPPASVLFTMAYDPARGAIVHYDGFEVHEWDGTRWSSRTPATLPNFHSRQAMIYDPQRRRVVLPAEGADVWEWDGDDWRMPAPAVPSERAAAAIAYDAAREAAVLFGGSPGLNDTWTWQGSVWRRETPAVSPPARLQHAMAFDSARGVIAMFGGYGGPDAGLRTDTWEWDGATWSQRFPAASPRARVGHAMVYDAAHRQLLMLGGISSVASSPFDLNGELLAELWTWNGGQWTRLTPERPPPPRTDAAMTYDAARGRVVLFGGRGFDPLGDTWEWDGAQWIELTPRRDRSPPPRFGHALIYDPVSRRSVLFGGYGSVGFDDTWAWDGAAWTELAAGSRPAPRVFHAMAFDPVHGDAVVFGGAAPDRARLGDTWLVRQADPAGPDEACHAGFDGDGDGKIGCADPDCERVCTGCGDGVCTAAESCRLCPADCGPCRLCGDLLCDPDEACSTCAGDCGPCAG